MQQLPPFRCSATGEKVCTAGARRVVVERIPTFPPATDSGLADYDLQTATTDYLAPPKGQWIGRRYAYAAVTKDVTTLVATRVRHGLLDRSA